MLEFTNNEFFNEKKMKGIPASTGITMGRALVIKPELFLVVENGDYNVVPEIELQNLKRAIQNVKLEYEKSIAKLHNEAVDVKSILQAELMILEDEIFISTIEKRILSKVSASKAVFEEFERNKELLRNADSQLLKERIIELDNLEKKILFNLANKESESEELNDKIIIAPTIVPTDFLEFVDKHINGIITESGGITSHLAILANSYKVPAIMGVSNATRNILSEDFVIMDAFEGLIIVNPSQDQIDFYQQKQKQINEHILALGKLIDLPVITKDKVKINLWCNANSLEDLNLAIINKAEGIGLVRTETLVMKQNKFPSEEEQTQIYKEIADICYPMPVTFRAFDLGSDKFIDNLLKKEDNPALGLRGIRYLLSKPNLFKTQIRSILRSSVNGNVRFMLPMITTIGDVHRSLQIINQAKQELSTENVAFDNKIKIGVMIETPSAAIVSDKLVNYVDFLSIGTNDLIQYVMAADRTNEFLVEYFNSIHISILKLIKIITEAAKKRKIPVAVCGELASHPQFTEILIGLGINELSVAPSVFLEIKEKIINTNYKKSTKIVNKLLKSEDGTEFI